MSTHLPQQQGTVNGVLMNANAELKIKKNIFCNLSFGQVDWWIHLTPTIFASPKRTIGLIVSFLNPEIMRNFSFCALILSAICSNPNSKKL